MTKADFGFYFDYAGKERMACVCVREADGMPINFSKKICLLKKEYKG